MNSRPPVSATATNLQFLDGAFVVDFPIEVLYSFYQTLQLGFLPLHCTANLLLDQTLHLQTTMATFKENESPRTGQCGGLTSRGRRQKQYVLGLLFFLNVSTYIKLREFKLFIVGSG